jgi:hypothetical protein
LQSVFPFSAIIKQSDNWISQYRKLNEHSRGSDHPARESLVLLHPSSIQIA